MSNDVKKLRERIEFLEKERDGYRLLLGKGKVSVCAAMVSLDVFKRVTQVHGEKV